MTDDNPAKAASGDSAAPTLRTEKRLRAGRRGGGRAGNTRGKGAVIQQITWSIPVNLDKPTEPMPQEGVEVLGALHEAGRAGHQDLVRTDGPHHLACVRLR